MTLGPFLFMAPLTLLGLIALPIIWYILRATPPTPKQAQLPSLRLLEDVDAKEETPARTPWWVLLLRLGAAALAILGLAMPIYAPGAQQGDEASGPVLVIVDDGWTSAQRWGEIRSAALSALDGEARDTAAHILLTAPRAIEADPAERLDRSAFEARIRSLQPQAWGIDRAAALERLNDSRLQPGRILWLTDGLDPESAGPFAQALIQKAPLSIYAARARGPMAITRLSANANGVTLTAARAGGSDPSQHFMSALTLDGAALATTELAFGANGDTATASFSLPPAALSRIARFQVTGAATPGTVWLWDSADRTRRVGLVSGDSTAQPLLSDIHYVRKALEPFATISEGELIDLIDENPDAIILTDIGQIDSTTQTALTDWIEDGGALIRFAGPRMAGPQTGAGEDSLVPAPLRRSSRAIGGTLTWEEPQPLGDFPEASPFAGLVPPQDIRVRQQVLARPGPELARRTWARLADGSPLVTADRRGEGTLVLFHVTAGPDWSDLPYAGVFVDMLRRSIAAGRGEAISDEEGLYSPSLTLNGAGQLTQPSAGATPLRAGDFGAVSPSETHPPGLYQGPAGTRALNVAAEYRAVPVTNWPAAATLLGDADARTFRLGGLLLSAALVLLCIDLIVALALAGRMPALRRGAAALVLVCASGSLVLPGDGHAQFSTFDEEENLDKETAAALDMRFAFIETGDERTDRATRAGLEGLRNVLFRRSSVEPAAPHSVDLETDALDVYPVLFLSLPDTPTPFSDTAVARLNAYMRNGGALFIDTRRGGAVGSGNSFDGLDTILAGLDTPALAPVPEDHVLTRSFYLLDSFPGRYSNRIVWIEATGAADKAERRGDGVSRLFVGDADYMAAWAVDERGRPIYSVDGGDAEREMATRFGINLIMYILTGNYKEDQVHIPALLERLGEDEGVGDFDVDTDGEVIP
ncbi:MAG: DUF4159 domain-containing protein [Hyphomonadaceae bacterium]|nr:DUF4159 domain-containing protein [Hyphomonadaceae bacterium]